MGDPIRNRKRTDPQMLSRDSAIEVGELSQAMRAVLCGMLLSQPSRPRMPKDDDKYLHYIQEMKNNEINK